MAKNPKALMACGHISNGLTVTTGERKPVCIECKCFEVSPSAPSKITTPSQASDYLDRVEGRMQDFVKKCLRQRPQPFICELCDYELERRKRKCPSCGKTRNVILKHTYLRLFAKKLRKMFLLAYNKDRKFAISRFRQFLEQMGMKNYANS